MLEKMDAFFEKRLHSYDEHMLTNIEGASEFYPYTAACLPTDEHCSVLDLGCGTGLELGYYFARNPSARVVGIDLSQGMLRALQQKFAHMQIELICASYFDVPLGVGVFDCAVSVESLHHFVAEQKVALYTKLWHALKDGGYFVLTDYFAPTDADEQFHARTLRELKSAQGIDDDDFYHYDTPLTIAHETQALYDAGFASVEVLRTWVATAVLKAIK